jgi:hypothetical protein
MLYEMNAFTRSTVCDEKWNRNKTKKGRLLSREGTGQGGDPVAAVNLKISRGSGERKKITLQCR